mmetsp:Transcript_37261/g.89063  ORF Transcript_37261/g.89063 Transcript_37261/m.89063 type:complete len:276 (+) Transcript_37261:1538-2365(+)
MSRNWALRAFAFRHVLGQKLQQHAKQAMLHHLVVKQLALTWRHGLGQAAGILQEEQALQVLLPETIEELPHEGITLLQVIQKDGVVHHHELRQGCEGGIVQGPRQHVILQILQAVVQVNSFQHLSVLECQDLLESHGDLQDLSVANPLLSRHTLVVLKHAHGVLEHVVPQVPLRQGLVRQHEDSLGNAPEQHQILLIATVFCCVKGLAQGGHEVGLQALLGDLLPEARGHEAQALGQLWKVFHLRARQRSLGLLAAEFCKDLLGAVGVLEAEGTV